MNFPQLLGQAAETVETGTAATGGGATNIMLMVLIGLLIFLIVDAIIFAFLSVKIFNTLVKLSERYKNAFKQIDVQLQRRYDLIPNLVEVAKGYLAHESETLEAVIAARNQAMGAAKAAAAAPGGAEAMGGLMAAEGMLGGALGRLMVVAEAYPDLKADQNMRQLSEELTGTENKIAFARQAFNDSVTAYNIYRKKFPNNIVAGMFGHQTDATLLELDTEKIADAPQVSFS